jgi:D-alanine transaminase
LAAYKQKGKGIFMENLGYYNGKYGLIEEMTVPMNDRACFFGDGIYDATYSRNRIPYSLEEHMDRFFTNAALMQMSVPMGKDELLATIRRLCTLVDSTDQFVYWQLTRGTAMRSHVFPENSVKPNLWITVTPRPVKDTYKKIKLVSMEDTRFFHCNIKTLNLIPSVFAAQKAASCGCDETVMHRNGRVTECAHANINIIKNETLITPPDDNLILPGVGRAHLMQVAKKFGYKVEKREFFLDDLFTADEVIVCSSGSFCLAVEEIDGKSVGGKAPEMLKKFQDELVRDYMEKTEIQ